MSKPKKVCVLGSDSWATAVAGIVGRNVRHHDHLHNIVVMYVCEEIVKGGKLSEVINRDHENFKYLPGFKLPSNVLAIPDAIEAAKDADAIIFAIPNNIIRRICTLLVGKIKPTASALSMVEGFDLADDGGIELPSSVIRNLLRINVSVLMGATLPHEVANGQFTEAVLGCQNKRIGPLWTDILGCDSFKVIILEDMEAVEVYGALKNVVAVGTGFVDGLELGDNTKSMMIRLGIIEMVKFVDSFYPGTKLSTFFETCGIGNLIATCFGDRNHSFGKMIVKSRKNTSLERGYLDNQRVAGPDIAAEVNSMLKTKDMESRFPVMTAIHRICAKEMRPDQFLDAMKAHSVTKLSLHNTVF